MTARRGVALALIVLVLGVALALRRPEAPAPAAPVERVAAPPPPAPPVPARVAAEQPAPDGPGAPAAAAPTTVLRGAWGRGAGEFGHTTEAEANPEGPMALAVAPDGTVAVLDARNRRIQRFVDGRAEASIELAGEAAQDLAVTHDGRLVALDRLGAASLTVYGRDGRPGATIALRGGPIAEGGAVTGVFTDPQGVYVEREHGEVVRLADGSGREDPARPTLWGRPSRDGEQLLRAAIEDRAAGLVRVSVAARANGAMDWSTAFPAGAPVTHLAMLDSDAAGRVYLAAATGRPTPDGVADAGLVVVRLDRAGAVDGALHLPALPEGDEVFRPLCVDDGGAVFVMAPSREGLEVRRYEFPR